jgi:hypothetical protein
MSRKTRRHRALAPALIVALAVLLAAAGCMQPIRGRTYDEVVAELGPPDACDEKSDGRIYCSWIVESNPGVNWEYHRVMLFDSKGRLVKSYPQSRFKAD